MTNNKFSGSYNLSNMNSVNNDHGYQKDEKYRKACQALEERCKQIEKDNEKLACR